VTIEPIESIRRHLSGLAAAATDASETLPDLAARYADMVREALGSGGKLMYAGNGGSAAAAEHIATEYVVRLRRMRRALPAMALTGGAPGLTAAANDFGFDQVFARLVEAHARPGDLLVLHSTSGRSPNLIEAARTAARIPIRTVALLDRNGGELASMVDLAIRVPADGSAAVQELQLAIEHAVADLVEGWYAADEVER
jgi:D-sedoheptulose 7-phosphate isomerase